MKKVSTRCIVFLIFILSACSNNSTTTVREDSPQYIKTGFTYYKTMVKVMNDIRDGEKVTVASEKDFQNEKEFQDWIVNPCDTTTMLNQAIKTADVPKNLIS
ncbi:hypothetical protein [Heyndrickxia camelliae]|uniref:Uncharacterized protein n=1 Tax=Heyndrickxia camelliae TaxID=1707093 RepID=A0A2N3LHN5_9BACI|nr:hypothetical protein [Heyndrickxia camelliae]PKR84087.1 hypothetical protein CWO92_16380 [Heyndrickxia camelliae]